MDRHRRVHRQLQRVTALQSLKAMASAAQCAAAVEDSRQAQAHLRQCGHAAAQESERLDMLLEGASFEFDAWRIGRAVLERLDERQRSAAREAERLSEREAAQREIWHRDDHLRDLATGRVLRLARKLASDRDEKAASEAVALRQAPASGGGE